MLSSKGFLPYLAVLSMLGFLATDMYLPAFGAMQRDFAATPGTISASLSLFLGGFACAQVLWGVLSDRFGRKPVLLAGLSLFALSCLAMLWVTDVWLMLALRFVQAVGVCAAAVSWQALVVDRYPQAQANKVFATIMPLVALSPALAPLLGAWLMGHFHWRAIFLTLALVTLVLLIGTLKLSGTPRAHHDNTPQPGWLTLLATRAYSGNVLIYAACSASFFAWLTGSPFILAELGMSPGDIGLSYVPQTLAFLAGGYGCRALLKQTEGASLLPWLLTLYALSVGAFFIAAQVETLSTWALLLPFCGMALANGAIYPIVVANALLPFPQASGKAAALQNTLQLGLCFVASMIVSGFIANPLATTSLVMLSTVFLTIIGYILQRTTLANAPLTHAQSRR